MTRARRSLHVLSCFRPEDLDVSRLSHGAVDFYELLDREIAGNTDLGSPASRAAASEQALGADPLVADLGDRLRARGARVWHQYDGVLNMVAAADPMTTIGQDDAEIPRPVAIESDGTSHYRRMSVRERSRLRPQLLERLGWRYMPLWTIEVFTDPSACADRIGGYLGLEKPAVSSRLRTSHGFFDDGIEHLAIDEARAAEYHVAAEPAGQVFRGHETAGQEFRRQAPASAMTGNTGSKEAGGMSADGITSNTGKTTPATPTPPATRTTPAPPAPAKPARRGPRPTPRGRSPANRPGNRPATGRTRRPRRRRPAVRRHRPPFRRVCCRTRRRKTTPGAGVTSLIITITTPGSRNRSRRTGADVAARSPEPAGAARVGADCPATGPAGTPCWLDS